MGGKKDAIPSTYIPALALTHLERMCIAPGLDGSPYVPSICNDREFTLYMASRLVAPIGLEGTG